VTVLVLGGVAEVRVDVMVVSASVLMLVRMHGNVAREQTGKHSDAGEQKDDGGGDVKAAFPTGGHRQSAEVGEQGGTEEDDSVTSREAEGEEGDSAEVVGDDGAEGGDRGQVIGAKTVQDACQKDSQKQHEIS
jgi:hypothetical protein